MSDEWLWLCSRLRLCRWLWLRLWPLATLVLVGARELDPAACASRFDVQRDKIIRTEESRDMGARYLSELDVGARHECLRLCCETDACDVFVYEEKSSGSCYLFNCGPPEDFRCKFTAHSNFSSGVLALSRRLAELQDQERLAQHEQELASLRTATTTTLRTTTTSTTTTSAATATAPRPQPRPPPQLPRRRCSRYEFECHSGDECIAVYNACDGVAQCADGSDEAPELACPSAAAAISLPPPPSTTLATTAQPTIAPAAEIPSQNAERWPHRLTQAQTQHRYNDAVASSHIFSHKGGLLQEPESAAANLALTGGMPQYPAFEPPWGARRTWSQSQQTGLEGLSGERGWMGGAGGAGGGYPRLDWPEPDPRRSWQEPDPRRAWPVPQPRPEPEMPVYIPPKTMPEMPLVYSSQQQTLRDSPKKGFELSNNKKPSETSTEAPRARIQPEGAAVQAADVTEKADATHRSVTAAAAPTRGVQSAPPAYLSAAHEREHDGLSEHPPAAVLLLVLGVAMTAAMAVMVGCRTRAARRRRLRRGKSSFAHDADYLVNGMYL